MRKRCLRLAVLVVLLFGADVRTTLAGCFLDLEACYYRAARLDSWVDRWLAGLDCELDFAACIRQRIGGW